jgi:L-fucono-1,5-lactonase
VQRLFDTHVHVWKLDEEKYPWNSILSIAKIPTYAFTAEQLLSEMDENQVERAVLIQPSPYGWNNRYLIEVLEKYPSRFKGVVLVNPADPEIEQQMASLTAHVGVAGVRFHLLEQRQVEVFRTASDRVRRGALGSRLVVTFQAHPGNIAPVTEMALLAPELTIVLDHLGLVWWNDSRSRGLADLLELATLPNVHVKLSGLETVPEESLAFYSKSELAEAIVAAFGPDRTMWGSNCPHALAASSYKDLAETVDRFLPSLSSAERNLVGWETAERVWD